MKSPIFIGICTLFILQTACLSGPKFWLYERQERRLKKKFPMKDCSVFREQFTQTDSENWKKDSIGSLGLRHQIFRDNPALFLEISFAGMSQACMEELLGKEAKSHGTAEKSEYLYYFPLSTDDQDSLLTLVLDVDIKQGKIIGSGLRLNTPNFPKGLVRSPHESCNLADSIKYKTNKEPGFLELREEPFHYLFALSKEYPELDDYLMGRHIDCIESRIGKAHQYVRTFSKGYRGSYHSFSASYYGMRNENFRVTYSYPELLITEHHYSKILP